ncbi:hypothetical protein ACSBR2_000596 [Camellia fascicularis]
MEFEGVTFAKICSSHFKTEGRCDSMVNAGISTKNVYSYLTKEVGGSEDVSFTKKDCYNYVKSKR